MLKMMNQSKWEKINWKSLIASLLISLGTGALASLITSNSMEQYSTMYNPPLSPPGWVFPVVWTILYILMGTAAYLVYESDAEPADKRTALIFYGLQLFINFTWSIIFFNFNAYLLAFAWLLLLWYLIYRTARLFSEINKTAGWLMVPYLLWVTFAGYLTLAIAINSL